MKKIVSVFGLLLFPLFVDAAVEERPLETWRFIRNDAAVDADPAEWERVSVPHTWNAADGHDGGSYYRGPGWYQKDLEVKPMVPGQRVFLRFDAVGTVADVFVDQQRVGGHLGGYTAFTIEITDRVEGGGTFDLRVRADNSHRPDVAPLSGDFTVFGGMHRKADVVVARPVCLSLLDHGSPGVRLYQDHVDRERADLRVKWRIDNGDSRDRDIQTVLTLTDADGGVVATETLETAVPAGEVAEQEQTLSLDDPHLWHGIEDPYLYRLGVELFDGETLIDRYTKRVGFRFYRVDAEKGFFLNGKPYRLRGVNMHQDRAGVGAAVTDAHIREDFKYIEEIGANALRLAHYPHSSLSYELSDELGLLVWAELPLVNGVTHHPGFAPNARNQLLDLIRQHGNHGSIFTWSVSNEIYQGETEEPIPLLRELNELAKAEDPTRPTVLATNRTREDLCTITDLLAFNSYPGWYTGNPAGMRGALRRYNRAGNRRGVGVSEYGAGGAPEHQSQRLKRVGTTGDWHPEQWQAYLHQRQYRAIVDTPFCWGSFVWAMFDFSSDDRDEGARPGVNDKGLMTHDRSIKKDAFYFYKANWAETPVLRLTSKRHRVRGRATTQVKVYGNRGEVTLTVNGERIGTETPDELHIARWDGVVLREGENRIEVAASAEGAELRDEAVWVYDPEAPDDR